MSNIETPTLFYLVKAEEYNDPIREDTYCLFNILTDKLILSQVFAAEITDFLLFNNPNHPWLSLSNESSEDWAFSISDKQMTLPLEWSTSGAYGNIYTKDYASLDDYLVKPSPNKIKYPTHSVSMDELASKVLKENKDIKILNEKQLGDIVSGLKKEAARVNREDVDRVLSSTDNVLDDIDIDIESIPYIEDE